MAVVVAAGSDMAAEAGARVAADGGNAVDAAVASIITAVCTEPGIVAPGAGAYLTIWPANGSAVVLDAYAEMPGRGLASEALGGGRRDVAMDYGGGIETVVGHGSVATPGAFAGLALAARRWGRLPWSVLMEPAIELVDGGFALSTAAAEYLRYSQEPIYGWDPPSRSMLTDARGDWLEAGDDVHVPDLGDSLRLIAQEGAAALYRGDLGAAIVGAVRNGGGILTMADLAAYEVIERRATTADLAGWTVATNPPPAVGGVTMVALLLLMAGAVDAPPENGSFKDHATIQRAVIDYRRKKLQSGDDRLGPLSELLDLAMQSELEGIVASASTTHTSACDDTGTTCAITASAGYGSGAMPEGTGFLLNNSLGELELVTNAYHSLAPGTRLVSNMAPTVARHRDGRGLAIGSPGADRITTALAQVLYRHLGLGEGLLDAIAAPRLHAEWFEGRRCIAYEEGLTADLPDGEVGRPFAAHSMFFGGVQAAGRDERGMLTGAADPRRRGAVAYG